MLYLDQLGALLALLATYCLVKNQVIAWPISLLATVISLFLYYQVGLYGDAGLAVFYFFSALYGWYAWTHVGNTQIVTRSITHITRQHFNYLLGFSVVSTALVYSCLVYYTDSDVAFFDATTTVLSLGAQWLMCRKIIQTWILWFIVDAINIGLFIYKGIPYHALLMMVYLFMAIAGYLNWQKNRGTLKIATNP